MSVLLLLALAMPLVAADAPPAALTPPAKYTTVTVERTRVDLSVNAAGSIRPKNRVVVPSPINGKVEWVIEESTRVKQGAEVGRIDCTEYAEALEQQKLELSVVEAELRRAKHEEQLVREQLEFEVRKAQLLLERARLNRSVLGPPTKTDAALSKLTVEQTRFAMEAADKEYQRLKKLGESGIESGRNIALARLRYERARADHLKAVADDELLLKGDPAEDIAVADQQLRRAEVALDLAKKRLESQAAFQATQVRVAEVSVERVEALRDLQQDRINRSRVTAPVDGMVLYPRQWGMPLREGDPVWGSNRFLDIADTRVMTVEAVINQTDWPRVKKGQKAEVSLIAYPDKTFHGVVDEVGKLARDRSLILREEVANVMSFHILVDVEEQTPELKPSYSARVTIVTDSFEDTIAVPRSALFAHESGDCVWVDRDGVLELRRIKVGPADAKSVVVESGLELGDRVVIPVQAPSEST